MNDIKPIVIVEDDSVFRNSIVEIIDTSNNYFVEEAFATKQQFIENFAELTAEIFWLDISLTDGTGIELIKFIKEQKQKSFCIVCTLHNDDEYLFEALKAGADGYLLKNTSTDKIINSLDEMLQGGAPMSPYIANRVIQSFKKSTIVQQDITDRERTILDYLSKGLLYKEIAAQLSISKETVKKHISNLYRKLHVQNRTEALLKYLK